LNDGERDVDIFAVYYVNIFDTWLLGIQAVQANAKKERDVRKKFLHEQLVPIK